MAQTISVKEQPITLVLMIFWSYLFLQDAVLFRRPVGAFVNEVLGRFAVTVEAKVVPLVVAASVLHAETN
jgi:hypothetical protein